MKIKVITNNPTVKDAFKKYCIELIYLDGPAQSSLKYARDLVVAGWHLAADPLAGYYIRFNPYHTVFLSDDGLTAMSDDVLRLEHAVCHLDDPRRPSAENTSEILNDYMILDHSLALNTLEGLCRYQLE